MKPEQIEIVVEDEDSIKLDVPGDLLFVLREKYTKFIPDAIALYSLLKMLAKCRAIGRNTPVNQKLFVEMLSISAERVRNARKMLEDTQFLEVEHIRDKNGRFKKYRYILNKSYNVPASRFHEAGKKMLGSVSQDESGTGRLKNSPASRFQEAGALYVYIGYLYYSSLYGILDMVNDSVCSHVNNQSSGKKRVRRKKKLPPSNNMIRFWPARFQNNSDFVEAWNEWCAHRKDKRASMTERATKLIVKRLHDKSPEEVIDMIHHSIESGYQGLYGNNNTIKKTTPRKEDFYDRTFEEMIQDAIKESNELNISQTVFDNDTGKRAYITKGKVQWIK